MTATTVLAAASAKGTPCRFDSHRADIMPIFPAGTAAGAAPYYTVRMLLSSPASIASGFGATTAQVGPVMAMERVA